MAFFEDVLTGNPLTGAIVGIGAILLAPAVVPAIGRVLRPAAKAVIKGSLVLYRDTIAEIGETAGDLLAEARAELEHADRTVETGHATRTEAGRAARAEAH